MRKVRFTNLALGAALVALLGRRTELDRTPAGEIVWFGAVLHHRYDRAAYCDRSGEAAGNAQRNYGDRCLKGLKTPTGKWAKSRSLRVATVRP